MNNLDFVVDTNIIMNILISGKASYKPLLKCYNFILPEFGLVEIDKYQQIIFDKSKLKRDEIINYSYFLFSEITILPNYILNQKIQKDAINLSKNVDIKDATFIALSMQLNIPLITRDKKLINGMKKRKYNNIILFDDFLQDIAL